MEDLKYPIGRFKKETEITDEKRLRWIEDIASTPDKLRAAVAGLKPEQLDTPYRPGGWTVRQVVHHLPDSHMNAYIRFRLALTESEPIIKPYNQDRWAELTDARTAPIGPSILVLEGIHQRWVLLLRSLKPEDFARTFNHPESGIVALNTQLQLYAWHGLHHVAQITSLSERMNWK